MKKCSQRKDQTKFESYNPFNYLHLLSLCMLGMFSCFRCRLLPFFKIIFFQKTLLEPLSECQTVWIQIRTDVLSVLIWVQTVCKGYHQTTQVAACKERVNKRKTYKVCVVCLLSMCIFKIFDKYDTLPHV